MLPVGGEINLLFITTVIDCRTVDTIDVIIHVVVCIYTKRSKMSSPVVAVSTGNRFSTLTPDDHGGIIWTFALYSTVCSFLALGVRCYIKHNNFGKDDMLCVIATV